MNITGKTMIFKSAYGYSTTISKKNQETGEYERMYIQVQLPKGVELENKTFINITNGFLTFYKNKQGLPQIKAIVMNYESDKEEQYKQEERQAIQEEIYGIQQDDLPF